MSFATYGTLCFLQNDSDFDLSIATERLIKTFPEAQVTQLDQSISIQFPDWKMQLHLADEPFIADEAKDLAEYFSDCPRATEIAACKRRVEIGADPDPNMDHFNDFVFVCQMLEEFKGVILFDPQSGQLI
jgi:hypothetical protein